MVRRHEELSPSELRAHVDISNLPFDTTADLIGDVQPVLGQERAIDAILFGMGMKADGYNIFVAGPPKTGLTYIAKTFLEEQARKEPTPPDWCYVYNFKEPDRPKAIKLSPGKGKELKKDMHEFIQTLQQKVPEVFDSDDYRAKEKELQQAFEKIRREIIEELSEHARQEGFILQFSQVGMVIIPAGPDGQPLSQEDLAQLSEEEKKELRRKSDELHEKMKEAIKKIREVEENFRQKRNKLDSEIALFVVGQLMETYMEKYKDEPDVIDYLKSVQEDILENIDDFKKKPEEQQQPQLPHVPVPQRDGMIKRYDVNVFIDNSELQGAPVIIESNPAYPNLFGTIERQAWFGALFTDFTMIKPGALHKANGGYLVMKALDLLKWYISWEALKRALRDKEIKIEDLGELYGLFSTRTIRPEPIPLNVKIVLTGDPWLYELLYIYDDKFQKLFKVKAHLDDRMDRNDDNVVKCARLVARFCEENGCRHMDKKGFARLIEYSMEKTEDREKLSLEIGDIGDLIREANYFASLDNATFISDEHVDRAVEKRIYRSNLIEEKVKELVAKDIFWVETDGWKVGQVNGLSILMTGDHEFGKPNRITATVSVGREGVIAIERESQLSGRIHTKGVMILTSFLKERFAHNKPISLTATLCFEQSYGMVEGDSASSTELYALLSAIAQVPIYQGIAVTGSVSQKGEIQPVGGVTRKIEAFFDICKHKGLNGKQGVIIPKKNVNNLMLKKEVIEAVEKGLFHIWPISTIEEGIEILTGMEAGKLQEDGTYPEGTFFRKVDDRLREIAEIVKKFAKEEEEKKSRQETDGGGCPACGS
ncbi:Lon protease family protein [Thermodesulforhabdus norvegica]|uniref:endopeptidase La n=1 Tax=Thermodesulforhabdus norvegica TaxID=39841 RepID=A0A1I4SJF0_9BACT|nr:ATP-binding protein [Thermodesulforhabdus norvegica]SFM64577.1 lon-related putative ATP-dependent protease [Thermodesulforhabdus norvegica]